MSRKIISNISESLEYLLHQDILISFEDIFIDKEDLLFCMDFLDHDDNEDNYYYSFEELFKELKQKISFLKECNFKQQDCFDYCSEKVKKSLFQLIDLGFKIESKIALSVEKSLSGGYIVEFIGYDFLPDEKKGITIKNYENLTSACDKFEKIHNSFLLSIKYKG